jgi:hypothetical protein
MFLVNYKLSSVNKRQEKKISLFCFNGSVAVLSVYIRAAFVFHPFKLLIKLPQKCVTDDFVRFIWIVIDHSLVLVFHNCFEVSIELAHRITNSFAECHVNLLSDFFNEYHFYEFERATYANIRSSSAAAA